MYENYCAMMNCSMCKYISSDFEFCNNIMFFLLLEQEDSKRGREDYILTLDEMYANDFPSPTDVDKDTLQTECNGLYFPEFYSLARLL